MSWSLSEIGVPSTTGVGASGTWGINITGSASYASNAGVAGYATNAGNANTATSATTAGTASNLTPGTYNINISGDAAYATNAGVAGFATNAGNANTATSATTAGTASALTPGTYNINISGDAAYASNAGVAGYATNAGNANTANTASVAISAPNAIAKDGASVGGFASNDALFPYFRRISDNTVYYMVRNLNGSLRGGLRNPGGYIEWDTDVGIVGTNYFVSDERKKDNIQPATYDSSALIRQINFIQFDWKPESGIEGHVDVGVSAQQVQKLHPQLVNEMSDGSLMINEPALISHMAKAIQELQAEVAALKTKVGV